LCIANTKTNTTQKKTKLSRSVLPQQIALSDHVKNLANAASITAGFMKKDVNLIGHSIEDVIVEPVRKHLIHGFDKVKKNAIASGALGVIISGEGTSIITLT